MTKDKPQIFIASSVEGLDVAYAAQELLEYNAECTVWDQGVFDPSSYTIPDLIERLKITDYGIFVFSIDDTAKIRGKEEEIVRDNVILELGLFMGAIGQKNCFIIIPDGDEKIHLPTDLAGITMLKYNAKRKDGNLKAALGPSINKIRNVINKKKITKKVISEDVIEQIYTIGLSAFYSSRDDYHGEDLQIVLHGQIGVGQRLGLDALRGVHDEHRTLAGGQRAGHLVVEVHVARGVDEVQVVGLAILGLVLQTDGPGLDGDAALLFQIHVVQQLGLHLALLHRAAGHNQPVGQGGFSVVNVGDDTEIADFRLIGHVW